MALHYFLFGEDKTHLHLRLRSHLFIARGNAILENFFNEVTRALRSEIATLPANQKAKISAFATLNDLNERSQGHGRHLGITNALWYVVGIAEYIEIR